MFKYIAALTVVITVMIATPAQAGRTYVVGSTSYCLKGRMADGTYTRARSVANNFLPLGSIIRTSRPGPGGYRIYVVRDRIGHGSALDFWTPTCRQAFSWGRRTVKFIVVRYGR